MKKIRQKLDVCYAVALVTFKEWGAYRSHSMVSIFVGPVYFAVQYFIWTAVYGNGGTLDGMGLNDIIRYFGATALIGYLTMDFASWNLDMLVRTGKFLTFSLRPLNHRFFAFSQKVGHRALGFILEFIPCLFIFVFLFKIDMRPAYLGWTVLSVILAYLMHFLVNYCLGMASFWVVQAGGVREFYWLISNIFSGMLIPLTLFPKPMQFVQFFLPFQYITYVPAMVFLGRYSLGDITLSIPEIVELQAVAVSVMFILSELIYKAAMKKFTAVGA